jgi:chromatin structure-remodeling complex subunit SFH1
MDHIEWDLLSPLTPEAFAQTLCMEVVVAHAIHEEFVKHKKDAIEWGVIGGDLSMGDEANPAAGGVEKAKGGWGVVKDKTGLGLNWGREPKDGRGPKTLKSVWRDWAEAEEFRTKFEELTAEEVERREIERECASRYVVPRLLFFLPWTGIDGARRRLRRETSKFQTTRNRRR